MLLPIWVKEPTGSEPAGSSLALMRQQDRNIPLYFKLKNQSCISNQGGLQPALQKNKIIRVHSAFICVMHMDVRMPQAHNAKERRICVKFF